MIKNARILVARDDTTTDQYAPGNKWHVDDLGRLHIVGQSGNIATYQPTAWASVSFENAT